MPETIPYATLTLPLEVSVEDLIELLKTYPSRGIISFRQTDLIPDPQGRKIVVPIEVVA